MTDNEFDAVKTRAYEIWEHAGRPQGQHEAHWEQAIRELGLVEPLDHDRAAIAEQARKWDEEEDES